MAPGGHLLTDPSLRGLFMAQRTAGNGAATHVVEGLSVQRQSEFFSDVLTGKNPVRRYKRNLQHLFQFAVDESVRTSTPIDVPPEYSRQLVDFAGESLAADLALMDGLDRRPRFHKGGMILDLQPGAKAMTLDRDVFVDGDLDVDTYIHEMVHVAQYGYTSPLRFLSLYFSETALVLAYHILEGIPFDEFRASFLERDAYAAGARFARWKAERQSRAEPAMSYVTNVPREAPRR